MLAYVDARDRVSVGAVDSRRRLWRGPRLPGVTALAWSPSGRHLLAVANGRLFRFDLRRRTIRTAAEGVGHVAWAPRGGSLAVVRSAAGRSEVVVIRGPRERILFTAPGRLRALAWSPDGTRLLVPWPEADQWLFLRPVRKGGRLVAVANIARQFMPGTASPAFPRSVQWCCPPRR